MEITFLREILIIFSLAVVVLFIVSKLKIPAIVGYLITGALAGPYGFHFVTEVHEVQFLAEIGIVLLLFTIGMELSFHQLLKMKKNVLLGGTLQVVFTTFITLVIASLFGQSFERALFIGFLISLSSTAIVLKLIQERAEVDSPHGRSILGILIFQDIIIVPMILFTPLLAGIETDHSTNNTAIFLF